MKKLTAKIFITVLSILGLFFGTLLLPTTTHHPFLSAAYADEGELDTPTNDFEKTDLDNPSTDTTENSDSETEAEADADGDPNESEDPDNVGTVERNTCEKQTAGLSWIICTSTEVIATAVDSLYSIINDFLVVEPVSMDESSVIYVVWQYLRNITNIIFVIFLLIVIYSQITGLGLSNYGIKRVLPRIIVTVILINLSFIICSIAVDLSNIIGAGLREFFATIQESALANSSGISTNISFSELLTVLLSGGVIAGVTIEAAAAGGLFWIVVPILFSAVVAIVSGLITIAARQALVALLIMVSPLAFVAYLLPNTERWFGRWKDLLFRMLVFYPLFSFLFGASQLVGWALISSATSPLGIILGLAAQVFPLFFSWSLMKMSGTILGALNTGLRKLSSPAGRALTDWANSQRNQARENFIAHSSLPGARLRRYLDERRKLRELDTENAQQIREGKAFEKAYNRLSSSIGRDSEGFSSWRTKASNYTRNAKLASIYAKRALNAKESHTNTLDQYGDLFSNSDTKRIGKLGDETFEDSMIEAFRAQNNAQAAQDWLLKQYFDAANNQEENRYRYNRLIKSAAGSLNHLGESAVMGQVIQNSAAIEARRRSEARIIINKFGIKKQWIRGLSFDIEHLNDNGREYDPETGLVIEDDQFRLIEGREHLHKPWSKYIAVHKGTNKEISKDEYDALSTSEKEQYRKVRYFDILNDKDKPVQRVFEDDAGYMKEALRDNIMVGDPINHRYLVSGGRAQSEDEEDGILRRYHTTISSAMKEARYKEKSAGVADMFLAQFDLGLVRNSTHLNLGLIQAISASSKPGPIAVNDSLVIRQWEDMLRAYNDDDKFKYYFEDQHILTYLDVNEDALGGLRLKTDEDGKEFWEGISPNDPSLTLEERKNLIRHKILPKFAKKLISSLHRDMSQGTLNDQKGDTLEALTSLLGFLGEVGKKDIDPNTPFAERMDPEQDLYKSPDPRTLKQTIDVVQDYIRSIAPEHAPPKIKKNRPNDNNVTPNSNDNNNPTGPTDSGGGPTSPTPSGNPTDPTSSSNGNNSDSSNSSAPTPNSQNSSSPSSSSSSLSSPRPSSTSSAHPGASLIIDQLERQDAYDQQARIRNDITTITTNINEYFEQYFHAHHNFDVLVEQLIGYFLEVECLRDHTYELENTISNYRHAKRPQSYDEVVQQTANLDENEEERIANMQYDVLQLASFHSGQWP